MAPERSSGHFLSKNLFFPKIGHFSWRIIICKEINLFVFQILHIESLNHHFRWAFIVKTTLKYAFSVFRKKAKA